MLTVELSDHHEMAFIQCHGHGSFFRLYNKGKQAPNPQELKECNVSAARYAEKNSDRKNAENPEMSW